VSEYDRWPEDIFQILTDHQVRQVAYVPDAGHTQLIKMCHNNPEMKTVVLTTEEEGVAMLAGAWLGGDRGALLMQCSGVGNCINMLSLPRVCRKFGVKTNWFFLTSRSAPKNSLWYSHPKTGPI